MPRARIVPISRTRSKAAINTVFAIPAAAMASRANPIKLNMDCRIAPASIRGAVVVIQVRTLTASPNLSLACSAQMGALSRSDRRAWTWLVLPVLKSKGSDTERGTITPIWSKNMAPVLTMPVTVSWAAFSAPSAVRTSTTMTWPGERSSKLATPELTTISLLLFWEGSLPSKSQSSWGNTKGSVTGS